MINITWGCNLGNCPYCWVNQVVRNNPKLWKASDYPAEDWIGALNKLEPAIFDFVGGEPLAFKNFSMVLRGLDSKHQYAVTSNLHSKEGLEEFLVLPKNQCIHFTGSFHPSGYLDKEDFAFRLNLIRNQGVNTSINIIKHESIKDHKILEYCQYFGEQGFTVHISPYEHPPDLEKPNDILLTCNAGITHYVINNNGDVHPCLSWFRHSKRDSRNMGNIFKGTFKKIKEQALCHLKCEMFYTVDKSNSMVQDLKIKKVENLNELIV